MAGQSILQANRNVLVLTMALGHVITHYSDSLFLQYKAEKDYEAVICGMNCQVKICHI